MTLEQLRVLNAIAQTGTFRGAAELLHKSQPALSHMIKALESETGLSLLSRDGYRPSLTRDGEIFLRQARKVLRQMEDLTNLVTNLRGDQEAEITLCITATCPLPPVLAEVGALRRRYPQTHIRLSTEVMGGAAERLQSGEADVILATLDGIDQSAVESIPYTAVEILPVAAPGFAAPDPDGTIPDGTLLDDQLRDRHQVVIAGTGSGDFEQTRDVLQDGLRWTVSDVQAKKEILVAGLGWGGLPRHVIEAELAEGTLVPLEVAGFPPRLSRICAIRRRDRRGGAVAQALWELLATHDT